MMLEAVYTRLQRDISSMDFGPPTSHVYRPLDYARPAHDEYLRRFGSSTKEIIFLGMNPGPFGMAQTGVPFGDVVMVRDWLGIDAPVERGDVLFETLAGGATPGKRAMDLRVVHVDGTPVGWSASVARNFLRMVDAFPPASNLGSEEEARQNHFRAPTSKATKKSARPDTERWQS